MGGPLALPLSLFLSRLLPLALPLSLTTHSLTSNERSDSHAHTPQFQTAGVTFQFFAQSLSLILKSFYDQVGHSRDLLSHDSPPKYRWGLYYKLIHSETCPGTKLEQQKVITDFMFYQHQFIKLHYYK